MFPTIETIDDVLPHIGDNIGFFVTRFADFDVIDYGFVVDNTFSKPMTLECRGLKFSKDGKLIARPFHKFFNLGEREPPTGIDWTRPHVVMSKLDGSMVHPCRLNGELVFMTRMGVTDQARAALRHADEKVLRLAADMDDAGATAIFEFTSPENRVVIAYDKPALTLLAAREKRSGRYLTSAELQEVADRYDAPMVETTTLDVSTMRHVQEVRRQEGIEGYVIAFEDGHRLKLKTSYYALRHKALSGLAHEKNVLAWVAEDALDDVLPLLPPQIADKVRAYRDQVMQGLARNFESVSAFVTEHGSLDRRTFADAVRAKLDKRLHPVAFHMLDGKDGLDSIRRQLQAACVSETRVDSIRDLYNMSWQGEDLALEAG
jgi:RNA ligase